MKKKKLVFGIVVIVLIICLVYVAIGNPIVYMNNTKLKQSITSITSESVEFNQIVPFEWDVVYTFEPYTSKDEIEKIIGLKSNSIQETISEGMVHLAFVKNQKVIASVCGYASNVGYRIDFSGKIVFNDNAVFSVRKDEGIVILSYAK